jgi:hypothetical protein
MTARRTRRSALVIVPIFSERENLSRAVPLESAVAP